MHPPNKQEPVLEIVLGTTIPLLIAILVFVYIVHRWYRNRQNERYVLHLQVHIS